MAESPGRVWSNTASHRAAERSQSCSMPRTRLQTESLSADFPPAGIPRSNVLGIQLTGGSNVENWPQKSSLLQEAENRCTEKHSLISEPVTWELG